MGTGLKAAGMGWGSKDSPRGGRLETLYGCGAGTG